MFLDDSQEVAKILHNLIEGTEVRNATVESMDTTLLILASADGAF